MEGVNTGCSKPVKLTDDATQKSKKTKNNNVILLRANKTKKAFQRFLHRGKPNTAVKVTSGSTADAHSDPN